MKRVVDDLLHEIEIGCSPSAVQVSLLLENPQQEPHVAMVHLKLVDDEGQVRITIL